MLVGSVVENSFVLQPIFNVPLMNCSYGSDMHGFCSKCILFINYIIKTTLFTLNDFLFLLFLMKNTFFADA